MSVFDVNDPAKFKNYVLGALSRKVFYGERLKAARDFVLDACGDGCEWAGDYMWIGVLPRFLNIASAAGRCNCDCRMCTNARDGDFRFLSVSDFIRLVENAPTARGVTFSAANSDPLMNPEFEGILAELCARSMTCDFYTNAIALAPRLSERILASGAVGMINFSLDAATKKTYASIRRRDFELVRRNIRYFSDKRKQHTGRVPDLSVSMVEMQDNIEELCDLVVFASSIGAGRVVVQALLGDSSGENGSALLNPRWRQSVQKASLAARQLGVQLDLPQKLSGALNAQNDGTKAPSSPEGQPAQGKVEQQYACCSWIDGVWVELDGKMKACCMNPEEDLGNLFDGSIWENRKFLDAKLTLLEGKVFPSCLGYTSQCPYLQDLLRTGRRASDYVCS